MRKVSFPVWITVIAVMIIGVMTVLLLAPDDEPSDSLATPHATMSAAPTPTPTHQGSGSTPTAPTVGDATLMTVQMVPTPPQPLSALAPAAVRPSLVDTSVPTHFHPQVASVVEAQTTGHFPERLSPFINPAPFDAARFAADPQTYLNTVEPGRVFQTAEAGPDALPLIAAIDHIIQVPALGSTPLSVTGKPGAPVSFTILDGGMFENHLSATTVVADEHGRAQVLYTATPGTVDDVQILVGSPLTVGTLTLMVHVAPPEAAAAPALSAR